MSKRLDRLIYHNYRPVLITFLTALLTAALLFVPFIIFDGGIFYYYGDFNVQEIPFYQLCHNALRSGQTGWSHITDLGSDFLSSYSFYLLGSPFFWLTIPFPNWFVPYLIGPLLILKFACAAASACIYLKRYVRNPQYAVLGGLLYAFSGFSIYNVFFFHFHEPMIVFPLLLAALDSFLYDKKRGLFAVAVFAAAVINYYFFVGQVFFVIAYFLVITLTKTYKFKIKEFLLLAAETLIGFFASAFILLPSVLGLLGNPRLDTLPNGWDSLVYNEPQRYWLIVLAFFFPADLPAFPVFTPDSNCKWASVAGWLPMFSMTGVIAYLQLKKRSWLKKLILLLILFAFVPVLNSMFQLFNSSIYYARWFYMLVLMFVLATLRALENKEADWGRALRWSAGITVGAIALIGLMPTIITDEDAAGRFTITIASYKITIGAQATLERFWSYALIALIGLLVFVLVFKKFRVNKRRFARISIICTLAVAYGASFLNIATGTLYSNTTYAIDNDILNCRDGIKIDDIDEVRSDFYQCVDNTAMFWKIQSINCFQSSVSTSIMQFYDAMGITRDVASRPEVQDYGLRAFLSCKYLFDYRMDGKSGSDNSFIDEDGNTKMPYWKYVTTCNRFDIYENECYIPMGFVYDSFVTEEEFERVDDLNKTEAILYSMVLTRDQMKKYSDITGYTQKNYNLLYSENSDYFDSVVDSYRYGDENYKEACQKLKAHSCSSFEYTDDGFKAHYDNNGKENLMFFSVPYSDGFTAYVNGEEADVEKVNYGFMAVKIPANTSCDIVFHYKTPGLSAGVAISLISLAGFCIYIVGVNVFRRRKKEFIKTFHK